MSEAEREPLPYSYARETLKLVAGATKGLSSLKLVVEDEFDTDVPGVFSGLAGCCDRLTPLHRRRKGERRAVAQPVFETANGAQRNVALLASCREVPGPKAPLDLLAQRFPIPRIRNAYQFGRGYIPKHPALAGAARLNEVSHVFFLGLVVVHFGQHVFGHREENPSITTGYV